MDSYSRIGQTYVSKHTFFCEVPLEEGLLQVTLGVGSRSSYIPDMMVKSKFGMESYTKTLCQIDWFQDTIMNFVFMEDVFLTFWGLATSCTFSWQTPWTSPSPTSPACVGPLQQFIVWSAFHDPVQQSSVKRLGVLCSFVPRGRLCKLRTGMVQGPNPVVPGKWLQQSRGMRMLGSAQDLISGHHSGEVLQGDCCAPPTKCLSKIQQALEPGQFHQLLALAEFHRTCHGGSHAGRLWGSGVCEGAL